MFPKTVKVRRNDVHSLSLTFYLEIHKYAKWLCTCIAGHIV